MEKYETIIWIEYLDETYSYIFSMKGVIYLDFMGLPTEFAMGLAILTMDVPLPGLPAGGDGQYGKMGKGGCLYRYQAHQAVSNFMPKKW